MKMLLSVALCACTTFAVAAPQVAKLKSNSRDELKRVKVLYAVRFGGDAGFARRLQREMTQMGFVWTRDKNRAEGLVEADTKWNDKGFAGHLVIRNRVGKVLWDERALRPHSSNRMAYQRLADRLRQLLGR